MSSPPCPLLHLSFYRNLSSKNCLLSPVLLCYNGSPDTRFFRETTRLMSWLDGECYLCPMQSLVVSFLLSLVSTLLISWIASITVSSKFFPTQVSSISIEELVLPHHACCVFFRCNGHSLLLSSYLSRIGRI